MTKQYPPPYSIVMLCNALVAVPINMLLDGTDDCGNICDHFCLNGVFGCACYHGYYLDADGVSCKGKYSPCTLTLFV